MKEGEGIEGGCTRGGGAAGLATLAGAGGSHAPFCHLFAIFFAGVLAFSRLHPSPPLPCTHAHNVPLPPAHTHAHNVPLPPHTRAHSYGFMGDLMAESEGMRWAGPVRYEVVGARMLAANRSYTARVSYLPAPRGPASVRALSCTAGCDACRTGLHAAWGAQACDRPAWEAWEQRCGGQGGAGSWRRECGRAAAWKRHGPASEYLRAERFGVEARLAEHVAAEPVAGAVGGARRCRAGRRPNSPCLPPLRKPPLRTIGRPHPPQTPAGVRLGWRWKKAHTPAS